jgi:hypothetical protein
VGPIGYFAVGPATPPDPWKAASHDHRQFWDTDMAAGQQVSMPEIAWVGCACDVIGWNAVRVTRASLDKQPHDVAAMFDQVADRYDLTNVLLSLGATRLPFAEAQIVEPEALRQSGLGHAFGPTR